MMNLSKQQEDVLLEVCNVGMSKAAKQLSVLLNGPVLLGNLKIDIVDIKSELWDEEGDTLSMVCQELTQDIEGYAVMFLKRDYSHILLGQMLGSIPTRLSDGEIRSCEQEAMLEIGNVLISSCTTAIVDMLNKVVGLNQPSYSEGTVKELVSDIWVNKAEDGEDLIVIATTMSTATGDFTGKLLLCMSAETVQSILISINRMLE